MTANQLYEACKGSGLQFCRGYIVGVVDAFGGGNTTKNYIACVPKGIEIEQTQDVAMQFLDAHPEVRQYGAVGLVAQALAEAFPCR